MTGGMEVSQYLQASVLVPIRTIFSQATGEKVRFTLQQARTRQVFHSRALNCSELAVALIVRIETPVIICTVTLYQGYRRCENRLVCLPAVALVGQSRKRLSNILAAVFGDSVLLIGR